MQRIPDVYDLTPVANVCQQILRELISLDKCSIAHVQMEPGSWSNLHRHTNMHEVYHILKGKGMMCYGSHKSHVKPGTTLHLPPGMTHQLVNPGQKVLEHLVIAAPPFDQNDVQLVNNIGGPLDRNIEYEQKTIKFPQAKLADDGVVIYEWLTKWEREDSGIGVATGVLPPGKRAVVHYHEKCDEVYFIVSGKGFVRVGNMRAPVRKNTLIHLPEQTMHGLENPKYHENRPKNGTGQDLKVVCVSSPAYQEGDFQVVDI